MQILKQVSDVKGFKTKKREQQTVSRITSQYSQGVSAYQCFQGYLCPFFYFYTHDILRFKKP
jgi:hypothetical protein